MKAENATLESDARNLAPGMWKRWMGLSASVHLGSLLVYPAFICGCHFKWLAIFVGAIPIIWGFYLLARYGTSKERVVAYVNVVLSLLWLWFVWESNIQFAFRR